MGEEDTPVTLVIKAPTQHVDDQTLECGMSWTIERLKRHISVVYPSKPNPGDQRLIYYGQVLSDKETLQDVLTRFEPGVSVHTLHLVCVPRREAMATRTPTPPNNTTNNSTSGAGDRSGDRAQPAAPNPQQPAVPPTPDDPYRFFMNPAAGAGYQPWMNDANTGYFQQLAWAQQAYANYYMSQYMEMLARQNGGQVVYGAPEHEVPRAVDPVPPRVEDDDRNRDWLDYLYVVLRMVVLISFVCYYSSLPRFLFVSCLGLVIYLYQGGFFRMYHPIPPLENNNEVLNNNVAAENNNLPQDGDAAAAGVGAAGQAQANAPEVPEPAAPLPEGAPVAAAPTPAPAPVLVVARPSLLTLTWTFFTGFLASLIPENPNVV